MIRRTLVASVTALALLVALPGTSGAEPGYLTGEDPMLTLIEPATGAALRPIVNVGEEPVEGFMFEGIPDGIGVMPGATAGSLEVFVNHEQSRVAFGGLADIVDSSVSHLSLNTSTGGVLDASVAIPDTAGFLRFCSATMAGPNEGLENYLFFTNEETPDIVPVPVDATYGPDRSIAPSRQGGFAVILDPVTGEYAPVPGMGRHNHENSMVVPGGWRKISVLSGDDTFSGPSSQLYTYLADSEADIWADDGNLWAFRVTHTNEGRIDPADPFNGANDYGDITEGDDWRGRFIRVPRRIARGRTGEPPQTALENWSNKRNVFQFIRIEDTAYDVNEPRVVYLADTGERRAVPDPATGRLMRGPSEGPFGPYVNGRIFRFEFDEDDPREVDSFSILVDGDAGGTDNPDVLHQPDNLGTSVDSLMIQEDTSQLPGSRVWRYDLATGDMTAVAITNDIDWESSGIVDVSEWFGDGAWLLDVQAHDVFVHEVPGSPGVTLKREDGQLVLMTIPGS